MSEISHLGITFCAGKKLKACIRKQCAKFYRACIAIFAKCGKFTSEVVILHLFCTACLPILMYALEVMPVLTVLVNKVNRCWFSVLARLFHVSNNSVIDSMTLYVITLVYCLRGIRST